MVLHPTEDHRQHGRDAVVERGLGPQPPARALALVEPGQRADRGGHRGAGLGDSEVGERRAAGLVRPDLRAHTGPGRNQELQIGKGSEGVEARADADTDERRVGPGQLRRTEALLLDGRLRTGAEHDVGPGREVGCHGRGAVGFDLDHVLAPVPHPGELHPGVETGSAGPLDPGHVGPEVA